MAKLTDDQIVYLIDVKKQLNAFWEAYEKLVDILGKDSDNDIDINDFISQDCPFPMSIDDFGFVVVEWVQNSVKRINEFYNKNK